MTDAASAALPAIERTLELGAPPDRVWRAISDPAELARWFPQRATWDLRPGGRGRFFWAGHGNFEIRVEAVDPPRYLAWRWGEGSVPTLDDPAQTTLVEWWVEPAPAGGTDVDDQGDDQSSHLQEPPVTLPPVVHRRIPQ
jgi:uncharacterized protein YndB with AHSA1/START domain